MSDLQNPGQLREAARSYNIRHEFRVGDVVEFKPLMQDSSLPMPCVVVALTAPESTLTATIEDRGSNHYCDEPDIQCGVMVDEVFAVFAMSSKRLQPYVGDSDGATFSA